MGWALGIHFDISVTGPDGPLVAAAVGNFFNI
jgi:hypothetical protein